MLIDDLRPPRKIFKSLTSKIKKIGPSKDKENMMMTQMMMIIVLTLVS
jgi:hypothetical protein